MPFLSEFLTTSFQNVRSKDRTDELHKALLNEILNANPEMAEYRWEFEYQLKEKTEQVEKLESVRDSES